MSSGGGAQVQCFGPSQFTGPCHQGKERVVGQPFSQSGHQREGSEGGQVGLVKGYRGPWLPWS